MHFEHEVQHGPDDPPLSERVWLLEPGTRVVLAPGTYRGPIGLPSDIALVAAGAFGSTTIEGTRGGTLSVEGAQRVWIQGLILKGPAQGMGAVLRVYNHAEVQLHGCLITGGRGQGEGGGGVDIQQGRLLVQRCRLTRNMAMQGGALRAGGAVLVQVRNSVFADNSAMGVGGGAVFGNGPCEVELTGCTFHGNQGDIGRALLAGGDALGAAKMTATNCLFGATGAELSATALLPGRLLLQHSVLPAKPASLHEGVEFGEGVLERRVDVAPEGARPWAATFTGLLHGVGDPAAFEPAEADLYGRPRSTILVGAVG